jgi:hypothetical protein
LPQHWTLLDDVGPNGAALNARGCGFKPGDADGDGYKNYQGYGADYQLFAAFLLFELWASDIHGINYGNPNAKMRKPVSDG